MGTSGLRCIIVGNTYHLLCLVYSSFALSFSRDLCPCGGMYPFSRVGFLEPCSSVRRGGRGHWRGGGPYAAPPLLPPPAPSPAAPPRQPTPKAHPSPSPHPPARNRALRCARLLPISGG